MSPPSSTETARPNHKILWRDLYWVLAFPVYQIVGTVRHEGAHALAVLMEGGKVNKFVFWPTWTKEFYWGYVQWNGHVSWWTSAAPYLVDLMTFLIFYFICTRVRIKRHWLWVNMYVVGLVSPLVNSGYRYVSSFFRAGDLSEVMRTLPPAAVHAYFLLTLALYLAVLVRIQLVKVTQTRKNGKI